MPKACRYAMALSFLVICHNPNTKLVIQRYLFFSTPPITPTIFPHNKHTKLPFTPKSPTTPHHHTHKSVTEASKRRDMPSACFKCNRQNAKALPRTVKALYQYHFCNFTPHYPTSKKIGGNQILMDGIGVTSPHPQRTKNSICENLC